LLSLAIYRGGIFSFGRTKRADWPSPDRRFDDFVIGDDKPIGMPHCAPRRLPAVTVVRDRN
jgi:hypothetical protein